MVVMSKKTTQRAGDPIMRLAAWPHDVADGNFYNFGAAFQAASAGMNQRCISRHTAERPP